MTKEELYVLLTTPKSKGGLNQIQEVGFAKRFPEIYDELLKINFPKDFTFRQKLYHYLKNIPFDQIKCKHCGGKTFFKNLSYGYYTYCCNSCAQSDFEIFNKINETKKERYGTVNNREKAKKTCLERYGVENPQQVKSINEKSLSTKHKKYGDNLEEITKKTKKTKFKKYGDENYNNIDKVKQTCLDKYGAENVYASEYGKQKIRNTNTKRYGVYHANKNKDIAKKISDSRKNFTKEQKEKWLDKYHSTMLKKYGVLHNTQIRSDFENGDFTDEQVLNIKEYVNNKSKAYHVLYEKYINLGIFPNNVSKIELDTYEILIDLFSEENIKCQYRCERYPFNCDFYIKSLDLFIELNAYWTHGNHPFDKNNEDDIALVEKWRNMNKPKYDGAIKTWTVIDVKKREIAKKNNLNYLEIFDNDLESVILAIVEYVQSI